MPLNERHPQYLQFSERWHRCRDAYEGSDAVKARGESYLPRLDSQSNNEYEAYKTRALWYGATARTVQGLSGAVTRKSPKITAPDVIREDLQDITLTGMPLDGFTKMVFVDLLQTGRIGILVDQPSTPTTDARPYWTAYRAEQIINWRTTVMDGKRHLTMVVLCEQYEMVDDDDIYSVDTEERYRVLTIENGVYWQRVYRFEDDEPVLMFETTPTIRGEVMDFIPFTFIGVCGSDPEPEKPPLLDMVDVNYSHFRSSADLEHGRHFTALPTPWIAGFPKDTKLRIGSTIAWVATDPQAHAGMLEFTGQGLGALERALESKEKLMAVLGARMLEEQKPSVEAADTIMFRSSGERSTLQSMSLVVGLGFTQCLRWHAMWRGVKDTSNVLMELNRDFIAIAMKGGDLTALFQVYQGGGISYETWYWNLQRGEIARPDITADDERLLVDDQQAKDVVE